MCNIIKQEIIELLEILHRNKGIVIYVTTFSLFIFSISLIIKSIKYSIAYIVCSLGSLVNLYSCERNNNSEVMSGMKKMFYAIAFTVASLGFLFI